MKKFLTAMLALVFVFSTVAIMPAFAANINHLVVSSSNGTVTVTGTLGSSAGAAITVKVQSAESDIVYLDQGVTGTNGAFSFLFKMSLAAYGKTYTVSVNGDSVVTPAAAIFVYAGTYFRQ